MGHRHFPGRTLRFRRPRVARPRGGADVCHRRVSGARRQMTRPDRRRAGRAPSRSAPRAILDLSAMSIEIRTYVAGPFVNNVYLLVDGAAREAMVVDPGMECESILTDCDRE